MRVCCEFPVKGLGCPWRDLYRGSELWETGSPHSARAISTTVTSDGYVTIPAEDGLCGHHAGATPAAPPDPGPDASAVTRTLAEMRPALPGAPIAEVPPGPGRRWRPRAGGSFLRLLPGCGDCRCATRRAPPPTTRIPAEATGAHGLPGSVCKPRRLRAPTPSDQLAVWLARRSVAWPVMYVDATTTAPIRRVAPQAPGRLNLRRLAKRCIAQQTTRTVTGLSATRPTHPSVRRGHAATQPTTQALPVIPSPHPAEPTQPGTPTPPGALPMRHATPVPSDPTNGRAVACVQNHPDARTPDVRARARR